MNYDQTVLMQSLGIDPATVMKGTIKVEFTDQGPVLTYTAAMLVPPAVLGAALQASDPEWDPEAKAVEADQPSFDELIQDAEARQTHADGYPMEEMGQ